MLEPIRELKGMFESRLAATKGTPLNPWRQRILTEGVSLCGRIVKDLEDPRKDRTAVERDICRALLLAHEVGLIGDQRAQEP